ncbi:conserved oligomeric Golgi complex subunit 7 [Bombus impatiens]|uniref:Conserved oligomeric Golgi complex subunit 7 n=1 Tax=Bombus impatiens TaxID=132113 RepID=A0A6P3UW01_BOMIM|nr:conserved oligomeric Golgi complex subunit 7 [Bombus impatiens]XP_033177073.1 conserved oligomeric Golgi complex subunit 7 [Bombus impatiens]
MDVSAFSEDIFDVKDWINKTFKSVEAQENKDAFVSSLVMKLQLYVQQVNGALEETSQSVLSSLPRVLRDTQLLQQEALALREKMVAVKQEIEKVEKDTASSMATLERIDKIKTDLQIAKQGLHEADNWSILANDVEEVFESGDIEAIANKLFSMQKSLAMLVNVIDYEDKKLQLEGLKNRLEAIASPKLVQAFTAANLEQSKVYVDIFSKMERLPQLLKYYHNCLKVSLGQEWRRTIELAQDENVSYWLHTYYDKLLSNWNDQVKWCHQVFPSSTSVDVIIEIYADLLRSLDPGIPECIEALLKQHTNAMQLSLLLELKQITRHFAVNLQGAIETSSHGKSQTPKLLSLAQAIYAPYVPYVTKYNIYETAQLEHQLQSIDSVQDDLSDTINNLSLSLSRVMEYANEANKRCKLFTDGCGYPSVLKSLTRYFNKYLDKYQVAIRQLEHKKVKHEDWNLFQMCLTLMQTIGDLLGQIQQFEKSLIIDITEANNKLQSTSGSVFNQYKKLLLHTSSQNELENLTASFQKEEETILDPIIKSIHKLCSDLHRATYEVIFAPIFTQLLSVQKAPAWSTEINKMTHLSADLPDYSFAPQEYITQVGQYLMTLPQHLEPFLLRENPSLTQALKAADPQYAQSSTESGFTGILLEIIAKETCQMFLDQTLGICQLSSAACKQLATDIDYLGNVLEELGLSLSENLQHMSLLLRLPPEDYQKSSSGCNARVVAAVRQMRNITFSG